MKITKIVRHEMVEGLTTQGWALVGGPIPAQWPEMSFCTEVVPNSGGYSTTHQVQKVNVIASVLFQLEKESDVISREAELCSKLDVLARAAIEAEKAIKAQTEDITKRTREAERATENYQISQDSVERAAKKNRRLEEDIAKIRNAIGEDRFKEIVTREP